MANPREAGTAARASPLSTRATRSAARGDSEVQDGCRVRPVNRPSTREEGAGKPVPTAAEGSASEGTTPGGSEDVLRPWDGFRCLEGPTLRSRAQAGAARSRRDRWVAGSLGRKTAETAELQGPGAARPTRQRHGRSDLGDEDASPGTRKTLKAEAQERFRGETNPEGPGRVGSVIGQGRASSECAVP